MHHGDGSLVTEEFMIPAADPGIQLYVRNKCPASLTSFSPSNVVLFVHGATYPAETAFDLQLDGLSWMDYMAQTLFPQLVNAEPKRLVIIGAGTHSIIMEKNRMQLFREVQMFLDEARRDQAQH